MKQKGTDHSEGDGINAQRDREVMKIPGQNVHSEKPTTNHLRYGMVIYHCNLYY
jgi:hypothetical protein